jgi:uncharacterized protein
MAGEANLQVLLRSMKPVLDEMPYGFVSTKDALTIQQDQLFAMIREDEGVTVVAKAGVLAKAGYQVPSEWARITLQIHSSLEAIGLTASFAAALGKAGISANVVAGFYHDHIFVQWDKRQAAMDALIDLSRSS